MRGSLMDRLAFALQDETMTRLQARRYVAMTLAAIEPGDSIGRGMVVVRQSRADLNGHASATRGHSTSPSIDFQMHHGDAEAG